MLNIVQAYRAMGRGHKTRPVGSEAILMRITNDDHAPVYRVFAGGVVDLWTPTPEHIVGGWETV